MRERRRRTMGTVLVARPEVADEPFTVDDLFELPPEWDHLRCEVIDGNLSVSPAATGLHQLMGDRLCRLIADALPSGVGAVTAVAVRLLGGDGPIPDIVVTTGKAKDAQRGFRAEDVHTVVEVVSPSNAKHDRVHKVAVYAEAGIPCCWRVEPNPGREHRGPVPVVIVRLHGPDGELRTIMAPAGREHELPVAVGRGPAELITVRLDPGALVADW